MKTSKTYYKDGQFLFLEGDEWPEEPKINIGCTIETKGVCRCAELAFEDGANRDVVDGYDYNCPNAYKKYLTSALEKAVPFEDHKRIKVEVICFVNDSENRTDGNLFTTSSIKEGLYSIPEIEVDKMPKNYKGYLSCCHSDNCSCNQYVARIISQFKESEGTLNNDDQKMLWKQALQMSGATMDPVKFLQEHFTITRKPKQ